MSICLLNKMNKGKQNREISKNKIKQLNLPETEDRNGKCLSPWYNSWWVLEVTYIVCSAALSMSKFC